MSKGGFLFLALTRAGWGETELGLRIAKELAYMGETVGFFAHNSNAGLLDGAGFPVDYISDETSGYLDLFLGATIDNQQPRAIVLSDMLTTQRFYNWIRRPAEDLAKYGIPLLAIDTWDQAVTGTKIDMWIDAHSDVPVSFDTLATKMVPIPIAKLGDRPDAYSCLPPSIHVSSKTRRELRRTLGLAEEDKIVIFCTAVWQHLIYKNEAGDSMREFFPGLMARYFATLPASVHWVHVGPAAYDVQHIIPGRYHWMNSMPPAEFDNLMASSDMLLSANISATTLSKAIACGVPAMVVRNPHRYEVTEDLDSVVSSMPADLAQFVRSGLPFFPFHMWPLGYHRFLAPLLENNDYLSTLKTVDMLDFDHFFGTCQDLIFNRTIRDDLMAAQRSYAARVGVLPSAGELVRTILPRGN